MLKRLGLITTAPRSGLTNPIVSWMLGDVKHPIKFPMMHDRTSALFAGWDDHGPFSPELGDADATESKIMSASTHKTPHAARL